jgi:hypothetical protein
LFQVSVRAGYESAPLAQQSFHVGWQRGAEVHLFDAAGMSESQGASMKRLP